MVPAPLKLTNVINILYVVCLICNYKKNIRFWFYRQLWAGLFLGRVQSLLITWQAHGDDCKTTTFHFYTSVYVDRARLAASRHFHSLRYAKLIACWLQLHIYPTDMRAVLRFSSNALQESKKGYFPKTLNYSETQKSKKTSANKTKICMCSLSELTL